MYIRFLKNAMISNFKEGGISSAKSQTWWLNLYALAMILHSCPKYVLMWCPQKPR